MPAAAALRAALGPSLPVVILPTSAPAADAGAGEGRSAADYLGAVRLFACFMHALAADTDGPGEPLAAPPALGLAGEGELDP